MADRGSHYERAFEAFLRQKTVPYVAVDEAKRALFGRAKLKGFDFLVYSHNGPNLLVDVKGRQLLGGKSLQTWTTERDVDDLEQWEQVFGDDFRAVFAFTYWTGGGEEDGQAALPSMPQEPGGFEHGKRRYRLLGVGLADYRKHMRRRSAKWKTVAIPAQEFRQVATPMDDWL
jgi:hypothetical protein